MFNEINTLTSSQVIGIQDTAAESGRFLIRELVSNSSLKDVHVLCYDHISTQIQEGLSGLGKNVHLHDCLPPLTPESDAEEELDKFLAKFKKIYESHFIILDSVSTLFLQKPPHAVYRILRVLVQTIGRYTKSRTVLLLHEDTLLNPRPIIAHLRLVCNVWIRVLQGPRVHIAVRRYNGKLSSEIYKCEGSSSGKIVWQKDENADALNKLVSNGVPVSTFKLTLSESEKKERDAVKLPYERQNDSNEPNSSAAIIYEPDEFDDWDEEDPDNDLEFS